jgi:lipopolysaccharide export system protein LptA
MNRLHRGFRRRPGATIACCLCLAGFAAQAEQADRGKPVEVEADVVKVDQQARTKTLEGNVVLVQGTMRLTAEKMLIKEDDQGFAVAQIFGGNTTQVAFRQKREGAQDYMEGFADRAEFDDRADTLKLFSKARLKNGGDELKGEYIYYNSATEVVEARNAIPGGKSTVDGNGAPPRVNVTIQPRTDASRAPAARPK